MPTMIRNVRHFVIFAAIMLLGSGCIQRTITIETEPSGALAYLNDVEIGRTPVTVPFTFYGTYDVRLELKGHQTLQVQSETKAPFWEAPGPDLIAEAVPGNHEVNIRWHYTLEKMQPVDGKLLVERARQLRRELNRESGKETVEQPVETEGDNPEGESPDAAPAKAPESDTTEDAPPAK